MLSLNKWTRKRLVFLRKLLLRNNVALASYPRSGNTWLTKLLEALSSRQVGSIYRDQIFPRPATGIVIKTHKFDSHRYNRFVHLVRNPPDCISSHYDFMHYYFPDKAQEWNAHLETACYEWKRHTKYWMQVGKPHITVHYEDLMDDPIQELRRLARFLPLDVDDSEIGRAIEVCKIDKLRAASFNRGEDAAGFFRKAGSGHGISRCSADEIETLEAELGELMGQFGYKIPSRTERFSSLSPTETSDIPAATALRSDSPPQRAIRSRSRKCGRCTCGCGCARIGRAADPAERSSRGVRKP